MTDNTHDHQSLNDGQVQKPDWSNLLAQAQDAPRTRLYGALEKVNGTIEKSEERGAHKLFHGKVQEQTNNVEIILDGLKGSYDDTTHLDAAKRALAGVVEKQIPNLKFALRADQCACDGAFDIVASLHKINEKQLEKAITRLHPLPIKRVSAKLMSCDEELYEASGPKKVILITEGDHPITDHPKRFLEMRALQESPISVDVIQVGGEKNKELETLAKISSGHYFKADNAGQLNELIASCVTGSPSEQKQDEQKQDTQEEVDPTVLSYTEKLAQTRKVYGETSPQTAKSLAELAQAYEQVDNMKSAEALNTQAIEILRKTAHANPIELAKALMHLAQDSFYQNKMENVSSLLAECRATIEPDQNLLDQYSSRALDDIAFDMSCKAFNPASGESPQAINRDRALSHQALEFCIWLGKCLEKNEKHEKKAK